MQVTANGVKLNYEIDGPEGAPWLTFSNSLASDMSMWDAQWDFLKDRYRVLRYDTRGHGGSEAAPAPYTMDLLVDDIIGLWDALGVKKSHFVGLSMGGMYSIGLAIRYRDRLNSIVCCNARADAPAEFSQAWDDRITMVREKGIEALVEPTIERWFTEGFRESDPATIDKIRATIRATSAIGYEGCARALQGLDYLSRMENIQIPALIIAGTQDLGTPPSGMREIAAKLPGSEFLELDPGAHFTCVERSESVNVALEAFLAKHT
ncbi:MAG: 3-oxoadipate enol-lactonase [Rhodospirillaceae bacterium]|jgi:3-oxoadipate enol-lactonase|nr:3-oxoadipate enol-lactonase [Rhodospirillales bacterium]MBT3905853.1 3-oxoadipate enol-lactonase [Rhodospirillaceae bacterium]MBT4702204.1 3-oxoadipate enol-lactonase [Rhodospirillaceae bacterium]MBT5035117.1 3-oxoadipate enol-lactonase [Rhodospirillaceae bacterium]MBT6221125.1 3-oxoadipate enol-lactonase [Rhodospirillaceae bacterium]